MISLTAPSVAMAVEGTTLLLADEAAVPALPDLGNDTPRARDDLLDRTLGWLAYAGTAGTDQLSGHVVNQGLAGGVDALRDSGLPFLSGLQGGVHYDSTGSRFSYDLLTVNRFYGDGDGHHWLAQLGAHNRMDRPTANVGLIYRWLNADQAWLLGGNLFYDRDFESGAQRLGTGVEAVTGSARVYANAYRPLGDRWYASPHDALREERAARGYDLGLTYTPSFLPALDLQVQGARWGGEAVDVFGNGQYLRDPTVWSAKIGYTPIPLLTLSAEQEHAAGGDSNTSVNLALTYRFGMPLAEQTRATHGQRTEIGFRVMAPVERENRIVTESRERFAPLVFAGPAVVQATLRAHDEFRYPLLPTGGQLPYRFALSGADAHRFELVGQELHLRPQAESVALMAAGDQRLAVTVTASDRRGSAGHQSFDLTVLAGTAPTASAVAIVGTNLVGSILTGSFTYADADGDAEGQHLYQWHRASDAAGTNRTAIAGATANTYTPTDADQGHYLVFAVTPVSAVGETGQVHETVTTAPVAAVLTSAPVASQLSIAGTVAVGSTLSGRFTYSDADGDAEGQHQYQWYRASDATGAQAVAIAGATDADYTIVTDDQGHYLVFEVTPRSATGSPDTGALAQTVTATTVGGTAPTATPSIVGEPGIGQTITGQVGYFDAEGDAEGAHTFQWYRADDAAGNSRVAVTGATALAYDVTVADAGKYLVFEVTPHSATGSPNSGSAVRAVTRVAVTVPGTAPTATPTISGTPTVGTTLVGDAGYFDADGDAEGGSGYQWYRASDAAGSQKTAIGGATALHYTVVGADQGQYLVLEVTPRSANGAPSVGAVAQAVTVVAATGTAPTAAPAISGTVATGNTLTGSVGYADADGDAEGAHAYQWYRASDAAGTNRTPISGATAATYTVVAGDQGQYLMFEVTPKSATGTPNTGTPTTSATASVVPGTAPTAAPAITGTVSVGNTLTGSVGYADADGDAEGTHIYQWYQADTSTGTNPQPIVGASGVSYDITTADLGKFLVFEVTPHSASGDPSVGTAVRKVTDTAVAGRAPTATPSITGIAQNGQRLTGLVGYADADGEAEGTHLYQWYRATDAAGDNRTAITGATSATYDVGAADVGLYLVFEVTPKSATGTPDTGQTVRTVSEKVQGAAPTANPSVSLSGARVVGNAVLSGTVNYADAEGDAEGTHGYQWYRADRADGTGKVAIMGATTVSYTPTMEDQGKHLMLEVTPKTANGESGAATLSGNAVAMPWGEWRVEQVPPVGHGNIYRKVQFAPRQASVGRMRLEVARNDGFAGTTVRAQVFYRGNLVTTKTMVNETWVLELDGTYADAGELQVGFFFLDGYFDRPASVSHVTVEFLD